MTLRDILVSAIGSLIIVIVVGHFKGQNAALISLVILACLLGILELFFYTKGLVIHQAWHGLGPEQQEDVTILLRGQIRDNKLNIPIDGTIFPHDPYRGEKKHVWVEYSYRSRRKKEKIRPDGERLILP